MKATGIVRRIDDLGRIVIPKEIRRTQRIRESDPMEIYTNHSGEILLKKYSPIGELGEFAQDYAQSLAQATGNRVYISDRDAVIAAAGPSSKDYTGRSLGEEQIRTLEDRKFEADEQRAVATIISGGDCVGLVVMENVEKNQDKNPVKNTWNSENALQMVKTASIFFSKITE